VQAHGYTRAVSTIVWLSEDDGPTWFPPAAEAPKELGGLLAAGGDLAPARLIAAYERGIFPWYSEGQPVLWWSPDPRAVLFPDEFHVSRSLRKRIRTSGFQTRLDTDFTAVIRGCSAPRAAGDGTWLTPEMIAAYTRLHRLGYAHSIETWQGAGLVGGLYGVHLGRVFFGESMFSQEPDASKIALAQLIEECRARDIVLIDCQIASPHLQSLGSRSIPRGQFLSLVATHCRPHGPGKWQKNG
jgi:leucyl/phenylalanyl-tRNA--protein transferase